MWSWSQRGSHSNFTFKLHHYHYPHPHPYHYPLLRVNTLGENCIYFYFTSSSKACASPSAPNGCKGKVLFAGGGGGGR